MRPSSLILAVVVPLTVFVLPRWAIRVRYAPRIYRLDRAPARPAAIVFGAGLRRDGQPTPVLADRVRAAAELFRAGRVEWILMSGSTRGEHYDEPAAMRDFALNLGVPPEAITIDRGGTRTLMTCLRARDLFGIHDALLVSQEYHLPRALTLCEALGIRADGAAADRSLYSPRAERWWELREFPASFVAFWEALWIRLSPPSAIVASDGGPRGA